MWSVTIANCQTRIVVPPRPAGRDDYLAGKRKHLARSLLRTIK